MTYVFEYVVGSDNVKVEYCFSSISDSIKVVDMWVNGKFHRTNWMSPEGNKMLMARLENDYLDNHSEWLGVTKDGQIMRQAATF